MKTKISALMDGELDAREVREVCDALRHDSALRATVGTYVLIGDALRQEPHLATELSGAVLSGLANEPVVLAPQSWHAATQKRKEWQRPLLAIAATLSGVAVVAWLGLTQQPLQQLAVLSPTQTLLKAATQPARQQPIVMASANDAAVDISMQEYLIAHQIHSGSVYLNGDAQHIRTVSMNGAEVRQ